jgi:hypothetical protein
MVFLPNSCVKFMKSWCPTGSFYSNPLSNSMGVRYESNFYQIGRNY